MNERTCGHAVPVGDLIQGAVSLSKLISHRRRPVPPVAAAAAAVDVGVEALMGVVVLAGVETLLEAGELKRCLGMLKDVYT
jgi:hypothetical protein